jgi:hypothetical protein
MVPQVPYVSPLFFFLGVYKKCRYAEQIRELRHLRERIDASVAAVTLEMLNRTLQESQYRLDCLQS